MNIASFRRWVGGGMGGVIAASVYLSAAGTVYGQASVARGIVEEAVEQVFRQAGKDGLEELTEMGGKAAVESMIRKAADEGGETLVRKVVQYGAEDGPIALRVISKEPATMVRTLDALAPELRGSALRAIDRDPQVMISLIEKLGPGAAEVAAKEPGVGEMLLQKLGSDGVNLGRSLSPDEAILAARHANEIAALSPTERVSVIARILKSPGPMLNFLEQHPKVLMTAAGVALFLSAKDDLIGGNPPPKPTGDGPGSAAPQRPGLIERLASPLVSSLQRIVLLVGFIVAAGIAGWAALHLLGKWRWERARAKAASGSVNLAGRESDTTDSK